MSEKLTCPEWYMTTEEFGNLVRDMFITSANDSGFAKHGERMHPEDLGFTMLSIVEHAMLTLSMFGTMRK